MAKIFGSSTIFSLRHQTAPGLIFWVNTANTSSLMFKFVFTSDMLGMEHSFKNKNTFWRWEVKICLKSVIF